MGRIEERARVIIAAMEKRHGKGTPLLIVLLCNGCGMTVTAPIRHLPLLLEPLPGVEGWEIGELGGHDYCPGCKMERN
jgi:hypothetical protein